MFQFPIRFRLAALLLSAPLLLASCDSKDPEPDKDNEQITTVTYTLTPTTGGGAAISATWKDLDGTGGAAPTISTLSLRPNTTYTGTISLLDETKTPAADIAKEVKEEANDHILFYTATPAGLLSVTRTDKDAKNLELGLTTSVVTNAAGTGTLKITLRHQPGTKNGTFTPGDTDAESVFPVTVQ